MTIRLYGISGIGKEYARGLRNLGEKEVQIIDYPDVLERECGDGILQNTYPGYEFSLPIPKNWGLIAVPDVRMQISTGRDLAIICTPPTEDGRAMVGPLLKQRFRILVEKPNLPTYSGVGVGYLYENLQSTQSVSIVVPRPHQTSWRWSFTKNPILWELGVHAISAIPPNLVLPEAVHIVRAKPDLLWFTIGRIDVQIRYTEDPAEGNHDLCLDGNYIPWAPLFDSQLERFLAGERVGVRWKEIQDATKVIENSTTT